jgi:hypothetical protein
LVNFAARSKRVDESSQLASVQQNAPDIGDIIQFRQSLQYLSSRIPFGLCFGPSATRQECVEASEVVYNRLLQSMPGQAVLSFDVLVTLTMRDHKGDLDEDTLSKLIALFRPDRDGVLTLLDFAKSVDTVYKELKMLRANVANASKVRPLPMEYSIRLVPRLTIAVVFRSWIERSSQSSTASFTS